MQHAKLIKDILAECRDDYVGLWSIVRRAKEGLEDQSVVTMQTGRFINRDRRN
jgi:hypothetical protein